MRKLRAWFSQDHAFDHWSTISWFCKASYLWGWKLHDLECFVQQINLMSFKIIGPEECSQGMQLMRKCLLAFPFTWICKNLLLEVLEGNYTTKNPIRQSISSYVFLLLLFYILNRKKNRKIKKWVNRKQQLTIAIKLKQ